MSRRTVTSDPACPCGSGRAFAGCCGPYLAGSAEPPTAEALMRSRYSAFVRRDEPWLRTSWHPDTCPAGLDVAADPVQWLGLKVLAVQGGGAGDAEGTVEFVARGRRHGRAFRLHEASRFVRVLGAWRYVDGEVRD